MRGEIADKREFVEEIDRLIIIADEILKLITETTWLFLKYNQVFCFFAHL